MKSLTVFFILYVISVQPTPEVYTGKVTGIRNGDTIEIIRDGRKFNISGQVRLRGIDAPELGQPFGPQSLNFLHNLLYSKNVRVVSYTMGRYKQAVADVFLDDPNTPEEFDIWVNKEILSSGYAWYYKHIDDNTELLTAEQTARRDSIGLWSSKNPIPPWEWYNRQR